VAEATGPAPESASPPIVKAGLSSPAPAAEPRDDTQELLIAQRYLEGKPGSSRDTAEAAKWLWRAVGKQNPSAAMLLADLYARGDGVSKSCDQARILLVAATKKGFPEAAEKLRRLERNGCP
jgi:TPR repeat protein